MKSLLEDMYDRNFGLQNDSVKHRKKATELSALIERHETDLKSRLNDEERNIFDKYLDCTSELNSLEFCSEFISGFRLGGRIVMEMIFGADDSELKD